VYVTINEKLQFIVFTIQNLFSIRQLKRFRHGSIRNSKHGERLPQDSDRLDERPSQDDQISGLTINQRVRKKLDTKVQLG
jgi:hypothetical protein